MQRLPDVAETERLTLRRWTGADLPLLRRAILENRDHLLPWMPWVAAEPITDDARLALIESWTEEWESGGDVVLGAFDDGAVVGSTGLHRRRGPGALEIGYWVHVDRVRRGYATEMARALTTAAFTVAGIDRVEIHHDRANVASRGVPEALGFVFDGEQPDGIGAPGEIGIDCGWSMTRVDWSAR
jgi:RimJ/RimL family protein N-acetyltransferase